MLLIGRMEFLRSILRCHFAGKPVGSVASPKCLGGPGLLPTRVGKPVVTSARCRLFSHANLRVLCGNLKQLLCTLRVLTHQIKICFWIEEWQTLKVRSIGMIRIRISDPRSLGSWCVKETIESILGKYSSVHLINVIRDHSYHWS